MSRLPIQLFIVLVFALTLFLLWDLGQRVVNNLRITQAEKELALQVTQAAATKTALVAQKTLVASPAYAEQVARQDWHWVGDNETIAITQETPVAQPTPIARPAPAPTPETPWWKSLLELLFGP